MVELNQEEYPLTLSPKVAGELWGVSERQMRNLCKTKVVTTLSRGGTGASWRIPTAALFDELGLPYEIISATPVSATQS